MKVIVSNTVTLNGGDAAILHAVVAMIREAFGEQVDVVVYDSQPEVASRYHDGFDFRRLIFDATRDARYSRVARIQVLMAAYALRAGWRAVARLICPEQMWPTLEEYAGADLICSTGGTYLVEHYEIDHRLFDFELCRILGTPLVFFTQSLGPFTDPRNVERLRAVFTRAPFVLLRDERSRGHLLDIGVPPQRLSVCADAVFALADEEQVEEGKVRAIPDVAPRVAISVRHWTHFARRSPERGMALYRASVAAIVTELVQSHGAKVTFVSTCQGISEYWTHDTHTADEIVALVDEEVRTHVRVDRGFHDPLALRDMLATFDFVVATRMHAVILSLIAGTAVLPIAYEFKTQELFEGLGAADLVLDIDAMTPADSLSKLAMFLETFDECWRTQIFEGVLLERRRAQKGIEALRRLKPMLERGGH